MNPIPGATDGLSHLSMALSARAEGRGRSDVVTCSPPAPGLTSSSHDKRPSLIVADPRTWVTSMSYTGGCQRAEQEAFTGGRGWHWAGVRGTASLKVGTHCPSLQVKALGLLPLSQSVNDGALVWEDATAKLPTLFSGAL